MRREPELSRKIYSESSITKTEKQLKLLGVSNKYNTISILNLRLFSSIIIFFVILYMSNLGYIIAPIVTIIYYLLFRTLFIDSKIKKRRSKLEGEAMHFFEVLTLSLETGRNLEEALNVTIKSIDSELSDEFKESIREVKYGKSLTEALQGMQENIPSESINNVILSLTQANIFGNSIIDSLYNQVSYIREKKKLEIKAEISKVPIKISIISVLFFLPLILLIILAPIFLNYIG